MATTTSASSNQKALNLADNQFLIAMGFNFNFTTWDELSDLACKASDEAKTLHLHIYNLLDPRINKKVLSGDSLHEHATSLFLEEFSKLEEKLMGLVQLLNEVDDTAWKQSKLIRRAIQISDDECHVDSLFTLGTKVRFVHRSDMGFYFGL
ncbi:MAG: hypothetical protein Q9208_001397 [Pyrenodesmia sp. 3 TL-2023]